MKTTSIKIDHHVYFDETYYDLKSFEKLFAQYNIKNVVFSPPCTKFREPEKSSWMYYIQRKLLMNYFGNFFCALISKSFYNDKEELRNFWKFFSNKQSLIKIINPDNKLLFSKIQNYENFKMWYWVNPKVDNISDVSNEIEKFSKKIYGIKFHQYWHSFKTEDLNEYIKLADHKNLPVYIILNYTNKKEILKIIKNYINVKFIFGYGGFPMFNSIWNDININKNCYIDLASNHIDKEIIKKIVKLVDTKRILFASDCPYNFKNKENDFDYNLFLSGFSKIDDISKNQIISNDLK